jgi:hypothetical protein
LTISRHSHTGYLILFVEILLLHQGGERLQMLPTGRKSLLVKEGRLGKVLRRRGAGCAGLMKAQA